MATGSNKERENEREKDRSAVWKAISEIENRLDEYFKWTNRDI